MVREVDRLGALEVGVAGHRPVEVRLGHAQDHALQVLQRLDRPQRVCAREHRHVRGHLVVARARGVQPPADGPDDLGQPPLHGHVDVLVGLLERELAVVELLLHPVQAAQQRVAVGLGDDPGRGQHARVRARLLDVVGPEPPVEADRRVQRPEDGVRRLGEARHGSPSCLIDGARRPPARPEDPVRPVALRVGAAVLRRLRRRRAARAGAAAGGLPPRRPRRELRAVPGGGGGRARSSGCWPASRWPTGTGSPAASWR